MRVRQKSKVKAYSLREVVELHQTLECGCDDGATAGQTLHMRQVDKQWREEEEVTNLIPILW